MRNYQQHFLPTKELHSFPRLLQKVRKFPDLHSNVQQLNTRKQSGK